MSEETPLQAIEFDPPSIEYLGALFNGYQFKGLVAKGGMGAVYKATQTSLDRAVAIKILPPELGKSESFRASFEKEAKLMAKLNHPNLISVYDFGEVEGMLYIVMEFVEGITLHEKSYNTQLPQKEALKIVLGICNGLTNAHEAGILHRDIKPANVFITENGTPKIGDFGLARPSGDHETGVIYGTPGYTAPEVLAAPDQVGPATDVFAVGIMLYELLTGKQPAQPYQPVLKYASCDVAIDTAIRKAIAPNLSERYASAEALADDLDEIHRRLKKANAAAPPTVGLNTAPQVGFRTTSNSAHPVKKKSGGLGKLFIILLLGGGIYGALEWKKNKEAQIKEVEEHNEAVEKAGPIVKIIKPTPPKKQTEETKPLTESNETKEPSQEIEIAQPTSQESLTYLDFRKSLQQEGIPVYDLPKSALILEDEGKVIAYVEKKLTWHEADAWSRSKGGQLITIDSADTLESSQTLIPTGKNAWVGAGTAGNKTWSWTDGTDWNSSLKLRPTTKLAFAQIDSDANAEIEDSSATAPFLIEWRIDRSTPATILTRMKNAADSLSSAKPLYPSGSVTMGDSTYYLCPEPLSFNEAQDLAKIGKAHLAVLSDEIEAATLAAFISKYVANGQSCRVGGIYKSGEWQWVTKEPWLFTKWAEKHTSPGDSAVLSGTNGKVKTQPTSEKVAYTLFEWKNEG